MIKKQLSFVLVCLLMITANSSLISAQTDSSNNTSTIAKVKADVIKLGTSEKNKVVVKMTDGRKLKGYINQAGDNSFNLADSKTGQNTAIAYQDVAQVKESGSKGKNIGLIVGLSVAAAAAIVVAVILTTYCNNEGC